MTPHEQILGHLLDTTQAVTGQEYFRILVQELTKLCGVEYAFVGMVNPLNPHLCDSVAVSRGGELIDNFSYELKDTPCENVIGQTLCFYPDGVQQIFPCDTLLQDMGIESYMGIPLVSPTGKATGLIVLLHTKAIPDPDSAQTLMRVVASRAGAELEREIIERALRESQAHLISSQRVGRVGSWELFLTTTENMDANALRWSDEAFRVFGYEPGEVEVTNEMFWERVHPDDRPKIETAVRLALENRSVYEIEHRIVLPGGIERIIHERAELFLDPQTDTPLKFIGTARDITDERRTEEMLRRSQKMQAIGQLAGGVAHDFNNLLTLINSYAEVVLSKLHGPAELRKMVQAIRDAGERATLLTRQLLLFSRKSLPEQKVIDLNALLGSTGTLLRRLIGEHISLDTELDPDLRAIRADPSRIEQIVMNLAINARDAMPDGGRLTIRTANVTFGPEHCRGNAEYRPGEFVRLTISDTGTGMTPEVKAHLFEPFFTTKDVGRGTGLGLATVYAVIQQLGGFVTVQSEPGSGASFDIYLPSTEFSAGQENPAERSERRLSGSETILLVEDEDQVREVVRMVLDTHGYQVLEAPSGPEAVKLMEAHSGPIDLVITDVVMPQMSGGHLVEVLRARRPDIKVLYMSGHNDDIMVRAGVRRGSESFLQKPFTPLTLAAKVRELFDARAGG